MTRRAELRPDVREAVGADQPLHMAVTAVGPAIASEDPVVFAAFPGGGYTRHYYDLQIPGYDGYSQAEFHASAGDVFLCCDHLGVGDSDVPNAAVDYDDVGRANAAAVRQVVDQLRAGALFPDLGPLAPRAVVGIGQSYGGFCLTIGQAIDPYFDGVAFLGWSGIATRPPWGPDLSLEDLMGPDAGDGLDHPLRPYFHHDTEPEDLILLDMTRGGQVGAAQPWGATHIPGGPAISDPRFPLNPGVVAAEAKSISVPVFVGAGMIDVIGDPWAEPTAYRGSRDVTVAVFDDMAHMHNFAITRVALWQRLSAWAHGVASCRITGAGR